MCSRSFTQKKMCVQKQMYLHASIELLQSWSDWSNSMRNKWAHSSYSLLLVIYWLICSTFTTYAWLWLFNKCKLTWIESRMWFSIKMTFLLPDRTPHTFLHFHFQMEKTLAKRNWIDLLFNGINRKSMRNFRIKHKNSKTKSTSYWLLNFQNYSVPLSPLHRDNHKHKQIPIDTTYKIQSV